MSHHKHFSHPCKCQGAKTLYFKVASLFLGHVRGKGRYTGWQNVNQPQPTKRRMQKTLCLQQICPWNLVCVVFLVGCLFYYFFFFKGNKVNPKVRIPKENTSSEASNVAKVKTLTNKGNKNVNGTIPTQVNLSVVKIAKHIWKEFSKWILELCFIANILMRTHHKYYFYSKIEIFWYSRTKVQVQRKLLACCTSV